MGAGYRFSRNDEGGPRANGSPALFGTPRTIASKARALIAGGKAGKPLSEFAHPGASPGEEGGLAANSGYFAGPSSSLMQWGSGKKSYKKVNGDDGLEEDERLALGSDSPVASTPGKRPNGKPKKAVPKSESKRRATADVPRAVPSDSLYDPAIGEAGNGGSPEPGGHKKAVSAEDLIDMSHEAGWEDLDLRAPQADVGTRPAGRHQRLPSVDLIDMKSRSGTPEASTPPLGLQAENPAAAIPHRGGSLLDEESDGGSLRSSLSLQAQSQEAGGGRSLQSSIESWTSGTATAATAALPAPVTPHRATSEYVPGPLEAGMLTGSGSGFSEQPSGGGGSGESRTPLLPGVPERAPGLPLGQRSPPPASPTPRRPPPLPPLDQGQMRRMTADAEAARPSSLLK